jgi:hypothetical protein
LTLIQVGRRYVIARANAAGIPYDANLATVSGLTITKTSDQQRQNLVRDTQKRRSSLPQARSPFLRFEHCQLLM